MAGRGRVKKRSGSPPDTRVAVRQESAKPLFEELLKWFEAKLPALPGPSALAGAIRYAITRMKRMRAYLESGICKLDNNISERSVKRIALGRKNICSQALTRMVSALLRSTP